jgi:3-deoxy-manno-octulosonate cytidylyltransferase (CMP-KDO synthetase)
VEQHGKNPRKNVYAIIPARFSSTRLEGKLLLPINGKSLILHTLEQTKKAKTIDRVIVATDDERILRAVCENGDKAVLTSVKHNSGSDRIAEVAETLPPNSIIINVQGDEPLISPKTIDLAVEALFENKKINVSTTCQKITEIAEVLNPNVVKVVVDNNNFALYFSRAPIPFPREEVLESGDLKTALEKNPELIRKFRKHTGLYVYRREFLIDYTKKRQGALEKIELLEQLRVLENGHQIKVVETTENSIGIDTEEDYQKVCQLMKGLK